jgi:hypothetical protein
MLSGSPAEYGPAKAHKPAPFELAASLPYGDWETQVMTNKLRIAGLVLAAVALGTTPALAQRDRRDGGGDRRQGSERAAPRARESVRPGVAVPRGSYVVPRSYGYNSYRPYAYRVPYGYRPYGYRPGWSLGLYFGAPYYAYGYPGYGYGPSAGYGYYSIVPGHAYGAVRIVDAPRDAQVFVDGYYAGVVDDYDGVFQHLNLEAGAHRIEIQIQGEPPISFDVRVRPGETLTYHAFGRN